MSKPLILSAHAYLHLVMDHYTLLVLLEVPWRSAVHTFSLEELYRATKPLRREKNSPRSGTIRPAGLIESPHDESPVLVCDPDELSRQLRILLIEWVRDDEALSMKLSRDLEQRITVEGSIPKVNALDIILKWLGVIPSYHSCSPSVLPFDPNEHDPLEHLRVHAEELLRTLMSGTDLVLDDDCVRLSKKESR